MDYFITSMATRYVAFHALQKTLSSSFFTFLKNSHFQLQNNSVVALSSDVPCLGIVSSFSATILEKWRNKFFFTQRNFEPSIVCFCCLKNWGFFLSSWSSVKDRGLYSGQAGDFISLPLGTFVPHVSKAGFLSSVKRPLES